MDELSTNYTSRFEQVSAVPSPFDMFPVAAGDAAVQRPSTGVMNDSCEANCSTPSSQKSLNDNECESVLEHSHSVPFCVLYRGKKELETPVSPNANQRSAQMKATAKLLQNSTDNVRLVVITVDEDQEQFGFHEFHGRDRRGAHLFSVSFDNIDLVRHSKKDRCFVYFTVDTPNRDLSLLVDGGCSSPTICHVFHTFHSQCAARLHDLLQLKISFCRAKRREAILKNRKIDVVDKYYDIHKDGTEFDTDDNNNNNDHPDANPTTLLDLTSSLTECPTLSFDPFERSGIFTQKGVPSSTPSTPTSNIELVKDIFSLNVEPANSGNQVQQEQLPHESLDGNKKNKCALSNAHLIASSYRFPDIDAAVSGYSTPSAGNICNSQAPFQCITASSMFPPNSQTIHPTLAPFSVAPTSGPPMMLFPSNPVSRASVAPSVDCNSNLIDKNPFLVPEMATLPPLKARPTYDVQISAFEKLPVKNSPRRPSLTPDFDQFLLESIQKEFRPKEA